MRVTAAERLHSAYQEFVQLQEDLSKGKSVRPDLFHDLLQRGKQAAEELSSESVKIEGGLKASLLDMLKWAEEDKTVQAIAGAWQRSDMATSLGEMRDVVTNLEEDSPKRGKKVEDIDGMGGMK